MKLTLLGLAAAAALAASGTAAAAPHTIQLVTKQHWQKTLDGGKHGASVGDRFVFGESLRTRSGAAAGFDQITCELSATWPHELDVCRALISLRGGTLVAIGATAHGPFDVAIVGGTGTYAGARGTAHVGDGSLTIRLLG